VKTARTVDVLAASLTDVCGVVRRARNVVDRRRVPEVVARARFAVIAATQLTLAGLTRRIALAVRSARYGSEEECNASHAAEHPGRIHSRCNVLHDGNKVVVRSVIRTKQRGSSLGFATYCTIRLQRE
jgi:hypothetical protein